jgi:hypothetical protein
LTRKESGLLESTKPANSGLFYAGKEIMSGKVQGRPSPLPGLQKNPGTPWEKPNRPNRTPKTALFAFLIIGLRQMSKPNFYLTRT